MTTAVEIQAVVSWLTPTQTNKLMSITLNDGTRLVDIKPLLLEAIQLLLSEPVTASTDDVFDSVYDFLVSNVDRPASIIFEQRKFDKGRVGINSEIEIAQEPEFTLEGAGNCIYCPSQKIGYTVIPWSRDEPAATLVRCVVCGESWRQ